MNKMREVAELLGLEWNKEKGRSEKFRFEHVNLYIDRFGLVFYESEEHCPLALHSLIQQSDKIKKLPWKPKMSEGYYLIDFAYSDNVAHDVNKYCIEDKELIEKGLTFRTKEEAQKVAEIMLKSLEGKENE